MPETGGSRVRCEQELDTLLHDSSHCKTEQQGAMIILCNVPATTSPHPSQAIHPSQRPSSKAGAPIANPRLHGFCPAERAVHGDGGNPSEAVRILRGRRPRLQRWTYQQLMGVGAFPSIAPSR